MEPRCIATEDQARVLLGLAPGAPLAAWRPAFNLAIKAAHPDLGGDADQARRVLEAYRILKAAESQRHLHPRARERDRVARELPPRFEITVEEAFHGVRRDVLLAPGQSFRVRLPAGLRSGDLVTFDEHSSETWVIHIAARPGMEVRGSDLWLDVGVPQAFLRTGGPLTIVTPRGERRLWVTRKMAGVGIFPAEQEGLPATGAHPAGEARVQLKARADDGRRATPLWRPTAGRTRAAR